MQPASKRPAGDERQPVAPLIAQDARVVEPHDPRRDDVVDRSPSRRFDDELVPEAQVGQELRPAVPVAGEHVQPPSAESSKPIASRSGSSVPPWGSALSSPSRATPSVAYDSSATTTKLVYAVTNENRFASSTTSVRTRTGSAPCTRACS